jgi:hypothetical protein
MAAKGRSIMQCVRHCAVLALLLVLSVTAAVAEDAPAEAADLPDARTIIDRHIAALGGPEAIQAQNVGTARGHIEFVGTDAQAPVLSLGLSATKRTTIITLPGMGEIRSGIDGDVVWSLDPQSGARILSAQDAAMQLETSLPEAALRDERFIEHAETVSLGQVEGQPCYRVRLTWKTGRESVDCYSTETGLLLGTSNFQESPMGKVTIFTAYLEYAELGGVKLATRIMQTVMERSQLMVIESLDLSPPDPALLELPEPVKAALAARTGATEG